MVTVFHSFHLVSCCRVYNQVWFHVFSVTHAVGQEKPQSFYMNVVDGVASLVEVISNRFVSLVFNISKVFFEAGVKGVSSFTNVELSAFGTMNGIYSVVCQAVELLCDVHLGLRASNVGAGADERTCSTFCLIAWSDPWCSCGCQLTQFRSLLHVMDVSVVFVCDQSWLTEVIANSVCDCKTPVGLDDFVYLVGGWVVQQTDECSLLSSCFVDGL